MDYQGYIRNEIKKGSELLDYEILTHQYNDESIFHYYDDSNPFYAGLIILRPDAHPSKKERDRSYERLEIKLAVRDALDQEKRERGYLLNVLDRNALRFPLRKVYYDDPYFQEDRIEADRFLDLFFGIFEDEKQKERTEDRFRRREIREDVLKTLIDVRTNR